MAEHLITNQMVIGSSPINGFTKRHNLKFMEEYQAAFWEIYTSLILRLLPDRESIISESEKNKNNTSTYNAGREIANLAASMVKAGIVESEILTLEVQDRIDKIANIETENS